MSELRTFRVTPPTLRLMTWGDAVVLTGIAVVLYVCIHVGRAAPAIVRAPEISLSPRALPLYALLSVGRMMAAYFLSLVFSLIYGSLAARRGIAEQILLPVLDVLQSVPMLSFLP